MLVTPWHWVVAAGMATMVVGLVLVNRARDPLALYRGGFIAVCGAAIGALAEVMAILTEIS